MTLYVEMTDGYGQTSMACKLVNVNEEREPVFEFQGDINFADPRSVMSMVLQLDGAAFPEPGEYRFQLFANHEFLMERRILATHIEAQDATDQPTT